MISRRRLVLAAGLLAAPAVAMDLDDYKRLGLHKNPLEGPWDLKINGRSNFEIMEALDVPGDAQYHPCAEATPGPDLPRGTILKFSGWDATRIYRGTTRDIWIYVPAGAPASPSLMVFNDGLGYADPAGPVRATAVLDTLIHAQEIPPTVGVFIMPGRPPDADDTAAGRQRSIEYDSLRETYVRFLKREVIPFAEEQAGLRFASEPSRRTIAGISSGGICAFNAAWHDPEAFGRVLSHCGSFVNIRGGHNYPYLVKTTPRKPIRVFLTSGQGDANILVGNWPLANRMMAEALEYAGYDVRFAFGEGGHSLRHGGALFAESLRWLHRPATV